jgi:hypothetical protein
MIPLIPSFYGMATVSYYESGIVRSNPFKPSYLAELGQSHEPPTVDMILLPFSLSSSYCFDVTGLPDQQTMCVLWVLLPSGVATFFPHESWLPHSPVGQISFEPRSSLNFWNVGRLSVGTVLESLSET